MKKLAFYIKVNMLYMFRNKIRLFLTILGIAVGLFIFMMSNIVITAYTKSLYKEAEKFDKDSYLVTTNDKFIANKLYSKFADSNIKCFNFVGEYYTVNKKYLYNEKLINNAVSLIGCEDIFSAEAVPYLCDGEVTLSKSKLLYGRDISNVDIREAANVIVIEKSAAELLFLKENAVGECIEILYPQGYETFTVIGVIEDFVGTKAKNLEFKENISKSGREELSNSFCGYIPDTSLYNMVKDTYFFSQYVMSSHINDGKYTMEMLEKELVTYGIAASIKSRESMINEIKQLEKELRSTLMVVNVILFVVTGIMIMTVYFFSVKERTYEIGIRRAIGASSFDIVKQFVVEGIIVSLLAGIVTMITVVIVCNFGTYYCINKLYLEMILAPRLEIIGATFGVSVLQGIVFSLLPSLVASKISPTEAIRWD